MAADAGNLTESERRLEEAVRLMATGEWETGPTHVQLAQRWGVAIATVEGIAAEASRVIRRIIRYGRDDDGIRAAMVAKAERIVHLALEHRARKTERVLTEDGDTVWASVEVPDPDFSAALRGLDLQARLLGVAKQTVEHSGPEGGPIPIEAAAVVVLPAQNQDGAPPALPAKPTNGKGTNGKGRKRGNGKGNGNGRG